MSSAKSLTLDLTCSGRPFMFARKRTGPGTEPCRALEETGIFSELIPLITAVTACFRLSKKSFIQQNHRLRTDSRLSWGGGGA